MHFTFQLGNNLFLKGSKLISYQTHVATYKNGALYVRGKFSRTTTKHIYKAANILKAHVIDTGEKVDFYKYEFGAKCQMENALSPHTSIHLLSNGVVPTTQHIWDYIIEYPAKLSSKDWDVFKRVFALEEKTPHPRLQKFTWITINHK